MKDNIRCKKWDNPLIKREDFDNYKRDKCSLFLAGLDKECLKCQQENEKSNYNVADDKRVSTHRDIAERYLSDKKRLKLPYPLNQSDESIQEDFKIQDCLSSKCLAELNASYSENIVNRICMALLKFDLAISYFDLSIKVNEGKIGIIYKEIEGEIENVKALLLPKKYFLKKTSLLETELRNWKKRLESEKEYLTIKPYDPLVVLKNYLIITPAVNMRQGRPSNPFWQSLQIVIYKLLGKVKNKGETENLTAKIINDFKDKIRIDIKIDYGKIKVKKSTNSTKLTAKDINNSIFT